MSEREDRRVAVRARWRKERDRRFADTRWEEWSARCADGGTARRLSALRPRAPIIATTSRHDTARRLALYWGVVPVYIDMGENAETAGGLIAQQLIARGLVAACSWDAR